MKIQEEQIVIIKNDIQTFDLFEEQSGIKALPKREIYSMIPAGRIGGSSDVRVSPNQRTSANHAAASRWATHHAILSIFIKSNFNWLLLIEDTCTFSESSIEQIEKTVGSGITLLNENATAYIVDKLTAKSIIENIGSFYAPLHTSLQDVEKLGLIRINNLYILEPFKPNTLLYYYLPLFLGFVLAMCLFFMLCPYDRFFTKKGISLSKMFASEEAVVSGKG